MHVTKHVLSGTLVTLPSNPATRKPTSHRVNTGPIVGGTVGGVVGLVLILGLTLWFVRRRKAQRIGTLLDLMGTLGEPTPFEFTAIPTTTIPEKRREMVESPGREDRRQSIEIKNGPSIAASDTTRLSLASGNAPGSSTAPHPQPRQEEWALGLQNQIEDLRRFVLSRERPEVSDSVLGDPPEYS